jgi:hypothetical protein
MGILKTIKSIFEHIRVKGLSYFRSAKRRAGFISAQKHKVVPIKLKPSEAVSYAEQLLLRRSLCPQCVQAGQCVYCKCDIQGLMTEPKDTKCGYFEEDEDGNQEDYPKWQDMYSPEEWEKFKSINPYYGFGVYIKDVETKNEEE